MGCLEEALHRDQRRSRLRRLNLRRFDVGSVKSCLREMNPEAASGQLRNARSVERPGHAPE